MIDKVHGILALTTDVALPFAVKKKAEKNEAKYNHDS